MWQVRTKWKDKGFNKFMKALARVEKHGLTVGFEGTAPRSGKTYAELAMMHEFGTTKMPARPFMRPTFQKNKKKYFAVWTKTYGSAVLKGKDKSKEAMTAVGKHVVSDLKNKVIRLRSPKNQPSTVKRKGGRNPLIDSGGLVDSIAFTVRKP